MNGRTLGLVALSLLLYACAQPERVVAGGAAADTAKSAAVLGATINVTCVANYDPYIAKYTYDYTVYNYSSSTAAVELFGLDYVGAGATAFTPAGWVALPGYQGKPGSMAWAAIGTSYSMPTNLDFLTQPSNSAIWPGTTAYGFRLVSKWAWGMTGYRAEPFVAPVVAYSDDDLDIGPFTDGEPTLWSNGVAGTVEAPYDGNPTLGADSTTAVGAEGIHLSRNPTSRPVRISFSVGRPGRAGLDVLDVSGRLVRKLYDARIQPGTQSVEWATDGESGVLLPAGVYFLRFTLDGRQYSVQSVVVLR